MDRPAIRVANSNDLPDLVRIYNHYVTATHVTFDTETFAVDGRPHWFESFSETGPHRLLVAEVASRLVGYASSREFRSKPAYSQSVETTVYIEPSFVGRRVGRALYGALLECLVNEKAVHRAYGGIAVPNHPSVVLHEYLGFTLVGTFREAGFKFGKYWDVSWYERGV